MKHLRYERRCFFIGEIMPRRIRRECRKLGCLNLTSNANGYCEVHQKETYLSYDRNRQSSSKRGYDSRWRKYRVWFLSLHPICNICKIEEIDVLITDKKAPKDILKDIEKKGVKVIVI